MLTMTRAAALATLAVLPLVLLAACADSPSAATPVAAATAPAAPTVPPTTRVIVTQAPPTTGTPAPTATSEYPKWVPKSSVDRRYTRYVDGDRMVMLAPGVYAEAPPDGVLGTADDYSAYLGNCTAIKRYSSQHPGGSTCWG